MKTLTATEKQTGCSCTHGDIRTDGYVLLAALLSNGPSASLLDLVKDLRWGEDLSPAMDQALDELNRAASHCPPAEIAEEFNRLFVGLGSGDLVPYGSWYLEKMIQSAPLAAIRDDLRRLGIVRQSTCFEPEDHAGALCEIMALLSVTDKDICLHEQAVFFRRHLASWMPRFFEDLQRAEKCQFYQKVGKLGGCFLAGESAYLHNFSDQEEEI